MFTRKDYVVTFLDSVKFCQREKGLKVFGWVVMSNHVNMIISSEGKGLSDIIRDIKKYTSSKILQAIKINNRESRKNWLLWLFNKEGKSWFWEEGYHEELIETFAFFQIKLNYIHLNPVLAGIVEKEEEYLYSSYGDYYGTRKGYLKLDAFED